MSVAGVSSDIWVGIGVISVGGASVWQGQGEWGPICNKTALVQWFDSEMKWKEVVFFQFFVIVSSTSKAVEENNG